MMSPDSITDPSELDHVIGLLRDDFKNQPHSRREFRTLIGLLIEDAKSDLKADRLHGWNLSDISELSAMIAAVISPRSGRLFRESLLNTLEDAAAHWLIALLRARSLLEGDDLTSDELTTIIHLGRVLLAERINAAKLRMEPHAERGRKVKAGSQSGHETTHGTHEEKKTRWSSYQKFVDDKHLENSFLSYSQCARLAAAHFRVALRTITRNTNSWKKNGTVLPLS